MIAPNTATHGNVYEESSIMDTHDKIDELLREPNLRLKVRRGSLIFSAPPPGHVRKALGHPMWIAVSESTDGEGKLASIFTQSALWHQRVVQGMSYKPVADFVVPGNTSIKVGGATSLSKAQIHKQQVTGHSFIDAVNLALLQGLSSRNQLAAWLDLTPYDTSLVQSVQNNRALQCVCSAFSSKLSGVKDMAAWFEDASKRIAEHHLRATMWRDFTPDGERPTYSTAAFSLCRPVTDGTSTLPLRQDSLTEWTGVFHRQAEAFEKVVQEHNARFNPSGVPWKQEHAPPNREIEDGQAEALTGGVERSTISGGHEVTSRNPAVSLIVQGDGKLYLHPSADMVIPAAEPLFYIFGAYHSGEEVQQRIDTLGAGKMFPIQISTLDSVATFTHPTSWSVPFTKNASTLKSFLEFLSEKQNVSQVDFVCHTYTPATADSEASISPTEACSFEPKKLPPRTTAHWENVGSMLDFSQIDWDTGKHKQGLLQVVTCLRYADGAQERGLFPSKPAMHMTRSVRVSKGQCYPVA